MNIKDKNIIIFGLGVTGISSLKTLSRLGANVFLYTDSQNEDFFEQVNKLSDFEFNIINNISDISWQEISYIIKSPGIKPTNDFLLLAKEKGVQVISDIEMAILIYDKLKYIAITGTNGKTTTTSLVAHLLNVGGVEAKVVGNIGVGILEEIEKNGQDIVYVMELSSFQLDSTPSIHADLTLLLNISPDHIDWHGSYEAYINAKLNIIKNLGINDRVIINQDDKIKDFIPDESTFERRFISTKELVQSGSILTNGKFYIDGQDTDIVREDYHLVGDHNLQNALFAIEAAHFYNISNEKIKEGLSSFKAIEHRLEFIGQINGVNYYNDSKGTNIDSTKKALSGFEKGVILIAGGYDKGVDFSDLFIDSKCIKELLIFGQTKDKLVKACIDANIAYKTFNNLDEIVDYSVKNSEKGDTVLLSPACASWDMYKSYEERGNHFKQLVEKHRENSGKEN